MRGLKILTFLDVKSRGRWALSLTKELAAALRADTILLTTERNVRRDPELLERAKAELAEAAGGEVTLKVRPGSAREAIVAEALESSPAVSIFPPAGRRGISRIFRGSRVRSVVQQSPSTVAVARRPASDHIRRVLVTVSGGPMSETTLLSAHEIARALSAKLTLLHVRSSVSLPAAGGAAEPERRDAVEIPDVTPVLADLDRGGDKPEVVIRRGMVVREILAECRRGGHDLLVLGQHLAVKEAGGPLSANIAELLAVECPIPVLIVRPRRWAAGARVREVAD